MEKIGDIDQEYISKGKIIIGVDEVGRGCIAGNMYIGFVSLDILTEYTGINDSKKLYKTFKNDQKRFAIDKFIKDNSRYLIMQVSVQQINTGRNLNDLFAIQFMNGLNILTNSMKVDKSNVVVFMDGLDVYKNNAYDVVYKPKLDALSWNVAAASIIAKNVQVTAMQELDKEFPDYSFAQHNGYATEKHRNAINQFGVCSAHRINWIR